MLDHLTDIDHHDHEAFIALAPRSGEIVGVARCIRSPDAADTAELAVVVVDGWQRRGLGTVLVGELAARAAELGISHFTADILAENTPTLALAHSFGETQLTQHGPTVTARIDNTSARPEKELTARTMLRALAEQNAGLAPRLVRTMVTLSTELTRAMITVPVASLCRRSTRRVS